MSASPEYFWLSPHGCKTVATAPFSPDTPHGRMDKRHRGYPLMHPFFFSYEGEKSFPEAIQCPVDLLLYPSNQNWNTCLFLNPSRKVGDGIIISDLDQELAIFFYKGAGSKHFRLCVQYMSVLYILPLLIFTTFINVKTILSHAPVC